MNKQQHAPGPWTDWPIQQEGPHGSRAVATITDARGYAIGLVYDADRDGALFAAAPELLEVARLTVEAFDKGPSAELLEAARSAIARATGEV